MAGALGHRPMPFGSVVWLAAVLLCAAAMTEGATVLPALGGSLRLYQFFRLEDSPYDDSRSNSELGLLRLTLETPLNRQLDLECHSVVSLQSPPAALSSALITSATPSYVDLEDDFAERQDVLGMAYLDRLNLRLRLGSCTLVVGRQAIHWGVGYFWPALDLFAPFSAQRIDRDYKPGVDAVRLVLVTGAFSEVEVVAASLGPAPREDGVVAALSRIYLGAFDLGVMGGRFHRDWVLGGFFTGDVKGTGVKGEFTWTKTPDPYDQLLAGETFWRLSLLLERQLSADWTLSWEVAYSGFGESDAADYLPLVFSERVRRGELSALGRLETGIAARWQLHPLWALNTVLLLNPKDPSALCIPQLVCSTGDNSELWFGANVGVGPAPTDNGVPRSEYGAVPASLFVGYRWFF